MKILIAGIGGVGGFFGGLLARQFEDHPDIQIHFLARGEHLRQIREHGLKVVIGKESIIARPKTATDNPGDIGTVDVILFCTKGYDLENTARMLKPCISGQTIIIPLLNGVDAPERIRPILPVTVTEGCVYIISRVTEPGVVENSGNIQKMFFGIEGQTDERLTLFEKICWGAHMDATYTNEIRKVCWQKFIFISPLATLTSFYRDSTIGAVRSEHASLLLELIHEVHALAKAKGIGLDNDIIEKTLQQIHAILPQHTTSMQRDILAHPHKSELESLTHYVIVESKKAGLKAAQYERMYAGIKNYFIPDLKEN